LPSASCASRRCNRTRFTRANLVPPAFALLLRGGESELAAELDRAGSRYGSISVTPRVRNQSHTRSTSFSGADAPEVTPTTSTPSVHDSSISVSSSMRCAATPAARAVSTRRFEFDELREPITSSKSISPRISLTAHWRFEVA